MKLRPRLTRTFAFALVAFAPTAFAQLSVLDTERLRIEQGRALAKKLEAAGVVIHEFTHSVQFYRKGFRDSPFVGWFRECHGNWSTHQFMPAYPPVLSHYAARSARPFLDHFAVFSTGFATITGIPDLSPK